MNPPPTFNPRAPYVPSWNSQKLLVCLNPACNREYTGYRGSKVCERQECRRFLADRRETREANRKAKARA